MARPITWQNVRGDSDGAVAMRSLELSRQTIGGSFDAFANILKQREALDMANVQAGQEGAKQAFLDQLAQAKTPEELAALQATGALDAARQGLGLNARAAVRGAEDARLAGLRQQVTAGQQYGDTQQDRASLPIRNNIAELVAAGRYAEARESLESSTTIRDKGPILAGIAAAERARAEQGFTDAERAHKTQLWPGEVSKQAANTAMLEAQAKAALAQAKQAEHGMKAADVAMTKLEQERTDAARQRYIDNSPMAYGALDSKTGSDALTKYLTDNKIHVDQQDDIRQQLNKYFPGGKMTIKDKNGIEMQVGVPVKAVLEAVGASEGNFLEGLVPKWSRRGDDTHNRLKALLERPEFQAELADTLETLNMSPTAAAVKKIKDADKK